MFLLRSGLLHLINKLPSISNKNILVPWAGVLLGEVEMSGEGLNMP